MQQKSTDLKALRKDAEHAEVLNCAIYTRVSTDMQAEKEFNSCEAQEEKIRSFIKSQENEVG